MLIREAMGRYPHAAQPHNLLWCPYGTKGETISER